MAKKKSGVIRFKPSVSGETAAPVVSEIEPVRFEEPILVVETVYAFPTKSRCPKCRTLGTRSTSTQGKTQFRKCRRPSCGTSYKESGTPI